MMIKWPERAKGAIRKLFEPLQEIDVYVEDLHDEAFYKTLLNKVSQGDVEIARVFSLGGRKKVVDEARSYNNGSRRALFIIDGDLDWVLGDAPPNIAFLHQHDAYCIENLLICEKALCTILAQEICITEDMAKSKLDFGNWTKSIEDPLLKLFSAFATCKKFSPEVTTVAQGVGIMCAKRSGKKTELDLDKVESAVNKALLAAKAKVGQKETMKFYNETLHRLKTLEFPLNAVSGKDFLLPLIDFWLQFHGCRLRRKSFKMRLATNGEIGRFRALNVALRRAAH